MALSSSTIPPPVFSPAAAPIVPREGIATQNARREETRQRMRRYAVVVEECRARDREYASFLDELIKERPRVLALRREQEELKRSVCDWRNRSLPR